MSRWPSQFGLGSLGATDPNNPLCVEGRAPITDYTRYQTLFGTLPRQQAWLNACGGSVPAFAGSTPVPTNPQSAADCPSGYVLLAGQCQQLAPGTTPTGPTGPVSGGPDCAPGYVLLAGQCQQIGPGIVPIDLTKTDRPPTVSTTPTCIGANYTVVNNECVYPAGGPSINNTPPLTLAVPNPQPIWSPTPAGCPDGSQPLLDGSCPVVMTPTASTPSFLTTLEGYLSNPVVLIGGAAVIYLMTRKTRRRRS